MPRRKDQPYIPVLKYFMRAPLQDVRSTLAIAMWLVEERAPDAPTVKALPRLPKAKKPTTTEAA